MLQKRRLVSSDGHTAVVKIEPLDLDLELSSPNPPHWKTAPAHHARSTTHSLPSAPLNVPATMPHTNTLSPLSPNALYPPSYPNHPSFPNPNVLRPLASPVLPNVPFPLNTNIPLSLSNNTILDPPLCPVPFSASIAQSLNNVCPPSQMSTSYVRNKPINMSGTHPHTPTQSHPHTSIQVPSRTPTQLPPCTTTQSHLHIPTQAHLHTSTQSRSSHPHPQSRKSKDVSKSRRKRRRISKHNDYEIMNHETKRKIRTVKTLCINKDPKEAVKIWTQNFARDDIVRLYFNPNCQLRKFIQPLVNQGLMQFAYRNENEALNPPNFVNSVTLLTKLSDSTNIGTFGLSDSLVTAHERDEVKLQCLC